jgi:transposase
MLVYIGIDWSKEKHDVAVLSEQGVLLEKFRIAHTTPGFERIETIRHKLDVPPSGCLIGMETAHNLLIDFLWDRGYEQIFVLPPTITKAERTTQHLSGAYNDASDAYLIATLLRSKRAAFYPWYPASSLIRQMRSLVSLGIYFHQQINRTSNRLGSILQRYYPAALQVFSRLDTFISLAFIQAFPTPQAATQVSLAEFTDFARQHHYTRLKNLPGCYARLQQPQPQALEAVVAAYAREAVILARMLEQLKRQRLELIQELNRLFEAHPDHGLFASLPGTGDWLAPALLAKMGEDRRRFPQVEYLQGVAGTCPVTKESGKHRQVTFRHACDHELRQIVQQWARATVLQGGWSAVYFQEVLGRCGEENQAYRCLGNRWLKILWRMWQDHKEYDDAYHLKQIALRKQPRP